MATFKYSYPQDIETVFRILSAPETARQRSEAFGEREINVTTSGSTVTNVRKVEAEVPGFAKKLLNPVNTVTDIKRWDPATKTAQLTVDIQGAPVKISGNIRLVPAGSGCDYLVDFQVSCKIPLIGGQLEKHVAGITEEGMRKEADWNKAHIG